MTKEYLCYKIIFCRKVVLDVQLMIFFLWRKNNVSFSKFNLNFPVFVKSTYFKVCDVIMFVTLMAISFESYVLSKQNLVKYSYAVWQRFLTCFVLMLETKTSSRPFHRFIKMKICRDLALFNSCFSSCF